MGPVVPNAWSEIIIKTQRNSAVKEHVWLHSTQVVSKSNWPGNPFIFFLITCSTISWKPLTEMLAWVQPFLWNLIIFLGMSRNSHYAMRRLLESTEKWQVFFLNICATHWDLIVDLLSQSMIKHSMFGKRLHDFSGEEYGNRKERNCLWIGLVEGMLAFPIWEQEAVDMDQGDREHEVGEDLTSLFLVKHA